jgi:hypothetical protein
MTTAGVVTEFSLLTANALPLGNRYGVSAADRQGVSVQHRAGSDGAFWFTESHVANSTVGRITTGGTVTRISEADDER